MKLFLKKSLKKIVPVISLNLLLPKLVMASTSGGSGLGGDMKAVDQLTNLQETISGPILTSISVIMIVVTALMLAFGEWGDGFKRLIQIVFWISIAAGASSLVTTMVN